MTKTEESFEEAFSAAVDEAFSSLGDSSKQAVYWYVTRNSRLQGKDLASNIEVFAAALEAFFRSGSPVIEMMILQKLSSRTGVVLIQQRHGGFVDSFRRMRKISERASKSRFRTS
jgi:hypothetical protein